MSPWYPSPLEPSPALFCLPRSLLEAPRLSPRHPPWPWPCWPERRCSPSQQDPSPISTAPRPPCSHGKRELPVLSLDLSQRLIKLALGSLEAFRAYVRASSVWTAVTAVLVALISSLGADAQPPNRRLSPETTASTHNIFLISNSHNRLTGLSPAASPLTCCGPALPWWQIPCHPQSSTSGVGSHLDCSWNQLYPG